MSYFGNSISSEISMLSIIDTVSEFCGKLAGWLFFTIGIIVVYEVVARAGFLAPTIWGAEMSSFLQIWATYLAAAYVLHNRKLIAIDMVITKLPFKAQLCCETISLLVIAIFSAVAAIYGGEAVVDSIRVGRASATMLSVPLWMTELAIPIGFGLLFLQSMAEIIRTWTGQRKIIISDY